MAVIRINSCSFHINSLKRLLLLYRNYYIIYKLQIFINKETGTDGQVACICMRIYQSIICLSFSLYLW